MLFVPCWQWIEAPRLEDLPDWLWTFYIDWVFVAPCGATAVGAADAHLERLEVLAEAVDRLARLNIGSPCVAAAVDAFERQRGTRAPLRAKGSLKRWAAASTSIFAKYLRHDSNGNPLPLANPRGGRPLKLGFLAQDWGESPATRARLPWLVGLDPARFEVHLFADRSTGDALENECVKFAEKLQLMPQRADERLDFLRFAELDVLIHGGDLQIGARSAGGAAPAGPPAGRHRRMSGRHRSAGNRSPPHGCRGPAGGVQRETRPIAWLGFRLAHSIPLR